jgi:Ca2+-binding RTX toxin-like protein
MDTYSYAITNLPPKGWETSAFKEGPDWAPGKAGFGTPSGPCPLNNPQYIQTPWPSNASIFLRKKFTLPLGAKNMKVYIAANDAARVFINGVDISSGLKRHGMACAERPNFVFDVPKGLFNLGATNTLAVRGVNNQSGFAFLDAQMTAEFCEDALLDSDGDTIPDCADPCEFLPTTEAILGTEGNDTLTGTPGNDLIQGFSGDDTLHGMGGDDCIDGGNGNDTLNGGAGNDMLLGQEGADTLNGGANDDILKGGHCDDTLSGGVGNDSLEGEEGNDKLRGQGGNDTCDGGIDKDTLMGKNGCELAGQINIP